MYYGDFMKIRHYLPKYYVFMLCWKYDILSIKLIFVILSFGVYFYFVTKGHRNRYPLPIIFVSPHKE